MTNIAIEHGPVEIVDLPSYKMVIFISRSGAALRSHRGKAAAKWAARGGGDQHRSGMEGMEGPSRKTYYPTFPYDCHIVPYCLVTY